MKEHHHRIKIESWFRFSPKTETVQNPLDFGQAFISFFPWLVRIKESNSLMGILLPISTIKSIYSIKETINNCILNKAMNKYYVVWVGRKPGIYDNLHEAQKQVKGFSKSKMKSFPSRQQAEEAFGAKLPAKPKAVYKARTPKVQKYEEPEATDKQMAFIESLRSQLGEMVFDHALKKLKLTEDDWTVYEASEMIELLLEAKDTPKLRVQIEQSNVPLLPAVKSVIPDMEVLLNRVVTELRIYRMEHPL